MSGGARFGREDNSIKSYKRQKIVESDGCQRTEGIRPLEEVQSIFTVTNMSQRTTM